MVATTACAAAATSCRSERNTKAHTDAARKIADGYSIEKTNADGNSATSQIASVVARAEKLRDMSRWQSHEGEEEGEVA